jgi:hypothetical protein
MTLWKSQHLNCNMVLLSIILGVLMLAACVESTVTPTTEVERAPSLEASITVAPIIPTESDDSIGRSDPTMAGLAAEGQPSPSFEFQGTSSVATPQTVSISIIADDGQILDVAFLSASVRPAPTVILLSDIDEDGDNWTPLAQHLHDGGYNVALPILRRTPDSPSTAYWQQARTDVSSIVENILGINNVSTGTIVIIGAGSGANLGLISCSDLPSCVAAIAISPQNDNAYLDFNPSISAFQGRSVMIVSADDDAVGTTTAEALNTQLTGDHTWQRYSGGGRGTALIGQADLPQRIVEWLQLRATPLAISTPQS